MRWTALLVLGACTGKGEGDDTGAGPDLVDTDTDTTTVDSDEPIVATANDPYVLAYAGCTATFTTTKGDRVDVTGTYEYDANGDRVRELIDPRGDDNVVENLREHGGLHEVSRVLTVVDGATSVRTYTWTDGHITRSEYAGSDGIVNSVTDWSFEGDFLVHEHTYDPTMQSGWWNRMAFTWTHAGSDHTAEYSDVVLEHAGGGTAVADDAGNILEQVGTSSTTLELAIHQTAPNAIGERTHSDRADFNAFVTYSTTQDWTLDNLGRVVDHTVVDMDHPYGKDPKETVTVTAYTYDCP